MDKRKVLLTAAIAGLFAAGAVVNQAAPVLADETAPAAGDKASCKGGSCKGEEKPAGDAAAPGGEKKSCKSEEAAAKGKKGGKHKGKAKKKKAEAPAS